MLKSDVSNGYLKISELFFFSIQGEGMWVGKPSIFVRMFGCNFTCSGFSMPRGEKSKERLDIDPSKYNEYNQLPLVNTGCDSYASWDPRFKHLSKEYTLDELVEKIRDLLPHGKFGSEVDLILTGGEPLLGWQKQYIDLFDKINKAGLDLKNVTFETNGTQKLIQPLYDFILANDGPRYPNIKFTFSVSSKLSSSGENWKKAIKPEVLDQYCSTYAHVYFKWVIDDEKDVYDINRAIIEYDQDVPVFVMAAGGTTEHYFKNTKKVAQIAMENGWRYSPRMQVDLWKNAWAT